MADERRRRQSHQSLYQHGFASDSSYGQSSQANFGNMRDASALPSQSVSGYEYSQTPQYASQQVQGTSYSYQSEYSQHLGRAPSGPQYPSSMMYNDSQLSQAGRHPSLDFQSEPAYQQRQSTAVEVLSNQFGSQQYDVSSVSQPSTIPSSYQSASVQHQGAYGPSADPGQTALTPGYSSNDLVVYQGSAAEMAQPQAPPDPFAPYHHLRRQVNTLIVQGRIAEARPSLLAMSNILVDGVERLQLNHDDTTAPGANEREKYDARLKYEARLTFWRNFHYSWVAFLQRQLNDTQTMLSDRPSGRVRSANLLSKDALEQLGDDVVRIANGLERYGLVDYEIGFFENEIIPMIIKCIDVLNDSGGSRARPRTTRAGS